MSHLTASGYKAEAVEKIFEKLDIDKSGCLSLEELIAGFANYTPLRKAPGFGNYNEQFKELIHADADALFNAIDGNNDGEITDAELRVHLRQFSNFSDAAITNIFSMLDTNANGGVDRQELRSAFVRSSALRQAIGQGPNFK
jgi:calcium-dependent protein kinase